MKKTLIFLLLIICKQYSAQQTAFLRFSLDDTTIGYTETLMSFKYYFANKPENLTSMGILIEELNAVSLYDFSKLTNLQTLTIQFAFNTEGSDSEKKKYISELNQTIKQLSAFTKCPKLKNIVFSVGNEIFLTRKKSKKIKRQLATAQNYVLENKLIDENLKEGWTQFGTNVQTMFPKWKIFACNVNW
jgi:hypothetical protein